MTPAAATGSHGPEARTSKSRTEETMTNPARSEDLLALYDGAPLDRRYWTIFSLLAVGIALDFFDFFIVALVAATLLGFLGWRGIAAVGVLPAAMGVLFILLMPESARWLVAKGRF